MMQRKREFSRWIISKELKDTAVVEDLPENEKGKPYVITPLGSRVKRILIAGSVTSKNVEETLTKFTLADNAGSFYVSTFKNDYQPGLKEQADSVEVGSSVVIMGRVSAFKTDDGVLYLNVNPEMISPASAAGLAYWISRTSYVARRKVLAIREANKLETPDKGSLVSMGYSEEEAECALRSIKQYKGYDLNGFLDVVSSLSKAPQVETGASPSREQVLEFIRSHSDPQKGTRYEDIVAHMKEKSVEQSDVDEILNLLGSQGDVYEVSLKRYKAV